MLRHLNNARLELQRASESHERSAELDGVTRLLLEAVRAITAARRQVVKRADRAERSRHLEVLP